MRGNGRIRSSPGRAPCTGAQLLSIHDFKIFEGPVERSLRPHGAILPFPRNPAVDPRSVVAKPHGSVQHNMSELDRRAFLAAAAAAFAGSAMDPVANHRRLNAMTGTLTDVVHETDTSGPEIRPFHVNFPDADLTDLKRRIKATRWPNKETVDDDTQGVQLATMQSARALLGDRLRLAQVRGEDQLLAALRDRTSTALDIHFIHVRSKQKNALPMIITHGWPGSIIEQLKIIGPLTDPTAYGGKPRTHSTSSSRRCRATVSPASRPRPAGPHPHRRGVGDADAATRLYALRRAGRRLGELRLGGDGAADAAGIARHLNQHGSNSSREIAQTLRREARHRRP